MRVTNTNGCCIKEVNAIVDTEAQVSIIEQSLATELRWEVEKTCLIISGVEGPDRKIRSTLSCYGFVKLPNIELTVIQLFFVMPKLNTPILLGSDFIKLLHVGLLTKPNGDYIICHQQRNIPYCLLTPLSVPAIKRTKKKETVLEVKIRNDKLERQSENHFNDLDGGMTQVIRRGISGQLTPSQRRQIFEVLNQYQDTFAKHKYDLGKVTTDIAKMTIDIGTNIVPCCKPYRLGQIRRRELNKIINEMIENDFIEESDAAGDAPALLVQKPDRFWRLVVNYIELNKICRKRCYPMPNVDN